MPTNPWLLMSDDGNQMTLQNRAGGGLAHLYAGIDDAEMAQMRASSASTPPLRPKVDLARLPPPIPNWNTEAPAAVDTEGMSPAELQQAMRNKAAGRPVEPAISQPAPTPGMLQTAMRNVANGRDPGFGGGLPPGQDDLAAAQTSIEQQAAAAAPPAPGAGAAPPTDLGGGAGAPAGGQNVPRGTQGRQGVEGKEKTSSTIQELIQGLNKRELKALESQGLTVDKLKKSLAELEGKDLPVDLTGLASLTDAWTGSNFAASYRPEETRRERTGAVEKLRGQITAAEQGMTESELAMLKNQLATQFQLDDRAWREKRAAIDDKFTREKLAIDWAQVGVAAKRAGQGDKMDAWNMRKDIEKLDTTKAIRGNIDLAVALNNYEKLVDKHAKSPGGVPAAELDNAYSAITLAYKNAGELGALSGPDMGIVEQGVGRAGGLGNWLKTEFKGGAPGIKKQIGHMRNATKAGFDRRFASMKEMTSGYEPLVSDYVGEFGRQMDEAVGRAPIDEQAAARAWVNDPKNAKDPRLPKIRASLSGGQ